LVFLIDNGYVVFCTYECYCRLKRASFQAIHVAMLVTSINLVKSISCDDGLSQPIVCRLCMYDIYVILSKRPLAVEDKNL